MITVNWIMTNVLPAAIVIIVVGILGKVITDFVKK